MSVDNVDRHVNGDIKSNNGKPEASKSKLHPPRDSKGWDGKLRIVKDKPNEPSPPESEDEDTSTQQEIAGEELEADEGRQEVSPPILGCTLLQ